MPSPEFLELRDHALVWIRPYYDGVHLERAGHWLLELEPEASEPLVIAALLHDMERDVPGGPVMNKRTDPWDDPDYNRAHCERSAAVVAGWLVGKGASDSFVGGVLPIREHEFGGSPEGDLMQACDSISFLETNGDLVSTWVLRGECTEQKSAEKLQWMCDRIRLERARPWAEPYLRRSLDHLHRVAAGEPG
jgi:hypothetical protein